MNEYMNIIRNYPNETCVIMRDFEVIYKSTKKGMTPLIEFYDVSGPMTDIVIADRIVGKSAALLAILLGARSVLTPTISRPAIELLRHHRVHMIYGEVVDFVRDQKGTGRDPFEEAVMDIDDPYQGYLMIKSLLE